VSIATPTALVDALRLHRLLEPAQTLVSGGRDGTALLWDVSAFCGPGPMK
jgi:hypothetical protein